MVDWRDCKLGDLLQIKHGFAFLGEHFGNVGTHIVLTPGNFLEGGGFKEKNDKAKWYSGPIPLDYVLNEGDLIVAMTEQAEGLLGSSAIIPRSRIYLHNQRLGLVQISDRDHADRHFIYYLFNSKSVRQQIRGSASGTKIRHTAPSRIGDVKVRIPPIATQRRIAAILSAYDDLIENNTRRIQILERMAQALYREWFVNFRFPGRSKVKLVDSPMGRIPEGWSCAVVNDFVSLKSGFAFKSTTFADNGTYGLVTIKNVHDGLFVQDCTSRIAELPLNMPLSCHLSTGDVLLSLTGNIGRACLVYGENYLLNQRVAKLVPREVSNRAYTYFTFRQEEFQNKLMQIANGVAQQNLSPIETGKMQVVLPPPKVMSDFADFCEPIAGQMLVFFRKNANLCRTRDLLLPKLISGALSVDDKEFVA